MRDITVCKFGGSSLADAECFRRVREIILSDSRRRCIVVSAPGKRHPGDKKITDLLISSHSLSGSAQRACLDEVRARFCRIAADLGIQPPYAALSRLRAYARISRDAIASRGEYLCAVMLAEYLRMPFADAADIFVFRNGAPDANATRENMRRVGPAVIPGFYGADASGNIVTFPRGGSDITASHISAATGAGLYENWTDVNGFYTADPASIPAARHIPYLGTAQARVFSYLGAGVLHYSGVTPAAEAGIPILIKNTFAPESEGTLITPGLRSDMPCVAVRRTSPGRQCISAANLTRAARSRALDVIPRHFAVTEYADIISFACSDAEMRKLYLPIHSAILPEN